MPRLLFSARSLLGRWFHVAGGKAEQQTHTFFFPAPHSTNETHNLLCGIRSFRKNPESKTDRERPTTSRLSCARLCSSLKHFRLRGIIHKTRWGEEEHPSPPLLLLLRRGPQKGAGDGAVLERNQRFPLTAPTCAEYSCCVLKKRESAALMALRLGKINEIPPGKL